jgi:hypothetical protein
MTTQELAQQILAIAHKALEQEQRPAVYIGDVSGEGAAHAGLEAIIKLCQKVPPSQEAFKQYEKKEVSHVKTSKD